MAKTNNFIELNGNRYDARTGAFLGAHTTTSHTHSGPAKHKAHHAGRGRAVDGIIRSSAPIAEPVSPAMPSIAVQSMPDPYPLLTHKAHHEIKPLAPHQPQHSQTLMRRVVKRPAVTAKKPLHAQAPADIVKAGAKPAVLGLKPKLSSEQIDPSRAKRAQTTTRSSRVVRFRHTETPIRRSAHAPAAGYTVAAAWSTRSTTPARQPDMFEQAIANATSHEQPPIREPLRHHARRGARRHVRTVGITAAILAAVLLGGFVAYQNKISLEMQLAAARAGFPASMPGFHPAGYAAKSLTYGQGTVTIGFRGPNASYQVIQKTSNWDSETLLQNFVATSGQPYNAYQAAGRTVYIYGNGNATWVNGGIWYQINAGGALSKDQIIELANSI